MHKNFTLLFTAILMMGANMNVNADVDPFSKNPATSTAYGYGAKATGGAGGTVVQVTNATELYNAMDNNRNNNTDPKIVVITQDITTTYPIKLYNVRNKTLLAKTGVKLTNLIREKTNSGILIFSGNSNGSSKNVIIRNITFVGPGAYDVDGEDLLEFNGVEDAWVDHCDFQDGLDDCFDMKAEMKDGAVKYNTDSITVSWCRFHYLKEPKAGGSGGSDDHRFACIVGSGSTSAPSDGRYNITWAYNWWDEGCVERMVRTRNSDMHYINDVWTSSVAKYFVGPEKASGRFDGCSFGTPTANHYTEYIWCNQNSTKDANNPVIFTDCSGESARMSSHGDVPAVSYEYAYDTAAKAKEIVTASTGAGATLIVDEQGNISAPTAINAVDADTSTGSAQAAQGKFVQNGRLVIMKNGAQYNAAGQRIK